MAAAAIMSKKSTVWQDLMDSSDSDDDSDSSSMLIEPLIADFTPVKSLIDVSSHVTKRTAPNASLEEHSPPKRQKTTVSTHDAVVSDAPDTSASPELEAGNVIARTASNKQARLAEFVDIDPRTLTSASTQKSKDQLSNESLAPLTDNNTSNGNQQQKIPKKQTLAANFPAVEDTMAEGKHIASIDTTVPASVHSSDSFYSSNIASSSQSVHDFQQISNPSFVFGSAANASLGMQPRPPPSYSQPSFMQSKDYSSNIDFSRLVPLSPPRAAPQPSQRPSGVTMSSHVEHPVAAVRSASDIPLTALPPLTAVSSNPDKHISSNPPHGLSSSAFDSKSHPQSSSSTAASHQSASHEFVSIRTDQAHKPVTTPTLTTTPASSGRPLDLITSAVSHSASSSPSINTIHSSPPKTISPKSGTKRDVRFSNDDSLPMGDKDIPEFVKPGARKAKKKKSRPESHHYTWNREFALSVSDKLQCEKRDFLKPEEAHVLRVALWKRKLEEVPGFMKGRIPMSLEAASLDGPFFSSRPNVDEDTTEVAEQALDSPGQNVDLSSPSDQVNAGGAIWPAQPTAVSQPPAAPVGINSNVLNDAPGDRLSDDISSLTKQHPMEASSQFQPSQKLVSKPWFEDNNAQLELTIGEAQQASVTMERDPSPHMWEGSNNTLIDASVDPFPDKLLSSALEESTSLLVGSSSQHGSLSQTVPSSSALRLGTKPRRPGLRIMQCLRDTSTAQNNFSSTKIVYSQTSSQFRNNLVESSSTPENKMVDDDSSQYTPPELPEFPADLRIVMEDTIKQMIPLPNRQRSRSPESKPAVKVDQIPSQVASLGLRALLPKSADSQPLGSSPQTDTLQLLSFTTQPSAQQPHDPANDDVMPALEKAEISRYIPRNRRQDELDRATARKSRRDIDIQQLHICAQRLGLQV